MAIKLAISGYRGRMGSLILKQARRDPRWNIVGTIEQFTTPQEIERILQRAELLIEFTTPSATLAHAKVAAAQRVAMVIGTTGLSAAQMRSLRHCATKTPIFWSPNMSIGVLTLRGLLEEAARLLRAYRLDGQATLAIAETHHAQKKDAPSGTAKQLREDLARWFRCSPEAIPISSVREGEVIGRHRVTLALGEETLTLEHDAASRRIFAHGALLVARFLIERLKRQPGFYTMDTVHALLAR